MYCVHTLLLHTYLYRYEQARKDVFQPIIETNTIIYNSYDKKNSPGRHSTDNRDKYYSSVCIYIIPKYNSPGRVQNRIQPIIETIKLYNS